MAASKKEEQKSVFQTLQLINVDNLVKQKGRITYLSWGNAWQLAKEKFPNLTRTVYENPETHRPFFDDGITAWVKVGVTINDLEHIDYLPVMDYRNQSIPLDKITSFDVNRAIQRSTAKALGMHGLALHLWSGEDIPELVDGEVETPAPRGKVAKAVAKKEKVKETELWTLELDDEKWKDVIRYIGENLKKKAEFDVIMKRVAKKYKVTKKVEGQIKEAVGLKK